MLCGTFGSAYATSNLTRAGGHETSQLPQPGQTPVVGSFFLSRIVAQRAQVCRHLLPSRIGGPPVSRVSHLSASCRRTP
eukprot:363384-Chlamydomonas_euryale.AAC.14